jgi:hypothetical protein
MAAAPAVEKSPRARAVRRGGKAGAFSGRDTTRWYNDLTRPNCQLPNERGSRVKPTNEKGGPKAAPSPAHLEWAARRMGFAAASPFKAGPKDLQRDGCNTMTPRNNAVNYGAAAPVVASVRLR